MDDIAEPMSATLKIQTWVSVCFHYSVLFSAPYIAFLYLVSNLCFSLFTPKHTILVFPFRILFKDKDRNWDEIENKLRAESEVPIVKTSSMV